MNRSRLPSLAGLLLLLFMATAAAVELRLDGTESMLPLGPAIEAWEDPGGRMTVEEVARTAAFRAAPTLLRPGHTRSAIWLRLKIANDAGRPLTRWIAIHPLRIEETSLFVEDGGQWQRADSGALRPFRQRPVATTAPALPLELAAGETQTVYLRIASRAPIEIRPSLWDPVAFLERENNTRLLDGLILGGLLFMALFGLPLLFMLREPAFLFYTLSALTFTLGEASAKGYSAIYLWPQAAAWTPQAMPLFAALGVGLNILFLRALIRSARRFPRIDRLLLTVLALQWLPAIGILFGDLSTWARLAFAMNFPATAILAAVGIHAMLRGVHAARYYSAAYALLTVGSLLHMLAKSTPMPGIVGGYALPVAMLLCNMLMLLSVIDRIIQARRERAAAQAELIAAHVRHGEELERTVEQRTADLKAALEEVRATGRARSLLTAYIGHDLRAPVATIINYLQLLGEHADPAIRRYKTTIERSARHQLDLIDDLVEYARGEFSGLELVPVPTYVHDWLDEVAGQAEAVAGQYGSRFTLVADDDIPPVLSFDPKRLRQVLTNLLTNAAKFTREGNVRLEVRHEAGRNGRTALHFTVEDSGPGIPADDMERIFQPFERRDATREGSGLGLSIARQLVRAMGGELQVESAPGHGCRFSFTLIAEPADENDVLQPVRGLPPPASIGTGKSILVADDSGPAREYLAEILGNADFDVNEASDGDEALQLAAGKAFDVLIVDQWMPGRSGWEVLRALRESSSASAAAPVVLCSAMPPQRPVDFPPSLHFAAVLRKPVDADLLLATLQEHLSKARHDALDEPPAALRAELARLVDNGSLTEIETWAEALGEKTPEWAGFAARARQAAQDIDIEVLNALCGSTTPSVREVEETQGKAD